MKGMTEDHVKHVQRASMTVSRPEDLGIVVSQGDCSRTHGSAQYAWEPHSCSVKQILPHAQGPVHKRMLSAMCTKPYP